MLVNTLKLYCGCLRACAGRGTVFVTTGDRTSPQYLGKGAFLCAFWRASGGKAHRGFGVSGGKASDWFGELQGVRWFVELQGVSQVRLLGSFRAQGCK